MDAIRNYNLEEFPYYLERELTQFPKNGYACMWAGYISIEYEKYSQALSYINNSLKYIPKEDKRGLTASYSIQSEKYSQLGDLDKAIEEISTAIKHEPKNAV